MMARNPTCAWERRTVRFRDARESAIPLPMPEDLDEEDVLPVPLDRETIAWLAELERATGAPARLLVASMLRDIRIDDEAAHSIH